MTTKKSKAEVDNSKIDIYSAGLCYCSVCAPKGTPIRRITDYLNSGSTGRPMVDSVLATGHRWRKSKDKKFLAGAPNPCPCPDYKGKVHYLFDC